MSNKPILPYVRNKLKDNTFVLIGMRGSEIMKDHRWC